MKRILLLCATVIAATTLAACGGGNSAKSDDKNKQEATELDVWLSPQWKGVISPEEEGADYDSFFKKAAEMYNEKHPDVKINVEVIPGEERDSKLSVATQTNSLPDIFFDSSFTMMNYAHQGLVSSLDDIIDNKTKSDVLENVWDNIKVNDKTYFYPFAQYPGMLVYNTKMFEDAGLEDFIGGENEIATWSVDDFQTILTTLKEKNSKVTPLGFYAKSNQGDTWTMMYLRMMGSPFFDEKGMISVNDKNGVEALSMIEDWNKKGLITSGAESVTSNDVSAMFQNQQTAISFINPVLYNGMISEMDKGTLDKFDIRLANIPGINGPQSFTYVLGSAVFNTNGEKREELAKDFVKFYSENEELLKASMNYLPVRKSVIEQADNPLLNSYVENDKYVVNFSNNTPSYGEVRNVFFPEIQSVLIGDKTPQEALDSFAKNANNIIEKAKKQSKILED
ncbi:multiple sugar transport system substrate-binding protein [Enterococcus sp. DIV0421]|uniref:ABC transporter substrate-binding protein n=1 Tax=Enterococcus sp. DIV0421 TaxID=2774688 RepID=UPI003F20A1F6